ncbi:MAG: adenylate/guanylate cyclase domain-containing protein [Betaproteobacteria bacterium]|nr:MAG: adenylate/guanylate cyclase domain-containing protein [Betaproteobacteria bacterium]
MNLRRRYREIVILAALLAAAMLVAVTGGRVELVDGFLYDLAIAITPFRPPPTPSKVVVVAIDEKSLASETLASTPRVLFGPYYAELLDGLFQGGAKAVGFDIIFNYTATRFAAIDPGYDDALLASLAKHRDRVVLARTATMTVAEPFAAAIFDPTRDAQRDEPLSIAYLELVPSEDGVQRWIYSNYPAADGTRLPTLAARLSEIAGGPGNAPPFLLAPTAPLESLPTYAIADVLSCIRSNPRAVRDRKRAPDRFLKWPSSPSARTDALGCGLQALGPSAPDSDTVPGVHIHAAAVGSLLGGTGTALVPWSARVAAATSAAVICAGLGLLLSPVVAVVALIGFLAALFAGSVVGVGAGNWLPVAVPGIAGLCALLGGQLARFFVEERRRLRMESAFGCYLAPEIVRQLSEEDIDLHLGGEVREISVMFADLSNFTAISDTMPPAELMELTNRYFKVIVEVIDKMGGYVDKFIGDAVMAMWGAPASAADSAAQALESAFLIEQRVSELRSAAQGDDLSKFDVKIGIGTGPAIVGNVGTPRRLSYTALGATVNLAERLEKVCGTFGCRIVVDSTTMAALKDRYLFCELDAVSLKGKRAPVSAYEAIAPIGTATKEQREYVSRYNAALQCYRNGDSEQAVSIWMELDAAIVRRTVASAPAVMAQRAKTGPAVAQLPPRV